MATNISEFTIDTVLCDSAVVAEGKLYLQGGGWNTLNALQFPQQIDRIGLALVVTVPYTQTNQNHTLTIRLEDQDGQVVALGQPAVEAEAITEIQGQFNLGRPPTLQPGDAQVLCFAVNLNNKSFDAPGMFAFAFSIDGTELRRSTFRVVGPQGGTLVPG